MCQLRLPETKIAKIAVRYIDGHHQHTCRIVFGNDLCKGLIYYNIYKKRVKCFDRRTATFVSGK